MAINRTPRSPGIVGKIHNLMDGTPSSTRDTSSPNLPPTLAERTGAGVNAAGIVTPPVDRSNSNSRGRPTSLPTSGFGTAGGSGHSTDPIPEVDRSNSNTRGRPTNLPTSGFGTAGGAGHTADPIPDPIPEVDRSNSNAKGPPKDLPTSGFVENDRVLPPPKVETPPPPVVETPPPPIVDTRLQDAAEDHSKAAALLEEGKFTDVSELRGEVARQKENEFNRMTHDALALQRDSGFIEATKVNAIRNANINFMDGMNSIKTEFNNNMLKLNLEQTRVKQSIEKEERATQNQIDAEDRSEGRTIRSEEREEIRRQESEDRDKEDEDHKDFLITGQAAVETLYASDPDAALALALEYASSTDEWTPWDQYENEAVARAYVDAGNKVLTAEYNLATDQALQLALGISDDIDPVNLANKKGELLSLFETNENLFVMQMRNQYDTLITGADGNWEDLGLANEAEAEMMATFMEDGDINAPGLKDAFINSYIKYQKEQLKQSNRRIEFKDELEGFSDDKSTAHLLDQMLEYEFGLESGGTINLTMSNGVAYGVNTFGLPVSGSNIDSTPGIDYLYTDFNGQEYGPEYSFGSELANSAPVIGVPGNWTNGSLGAAYDAYIKKMSKRYNNMNEGDKAVFGETILNQEGFKQALIDTGSLDEIMGQVATVGGDTIDTAAEFISTKTGEKTSFNKLKVDPANFLNVTLASGAVFNDGENKVKRLLNGDLTMADFPSSDWVPMMAIDAQNGGWLRKALVDEGIIKSEDKGVGTPGDVSSATEYEFAGTSNIMMSEFNDNSQFSGTMGSELYRSLSGSGPVKKGKMLIGGELYTVTGTITTNSINTEFTNSGTTKGTNGSVNMVTPLIEWKLTPINQPNEEVTLRGQVDIGGGPVYVTADNVPNLDQMINDSIFNDDRSATLPDGTPFWTDYGEDVTSSNKEEDSFSSRLTGGG